MKLVHYSKYEILSLQERPYNQNKMKWQAKPNGLWISVEGEEEGDTWKEWCESEDFKLESLKYSYEIFLKDSANILYIQTADQLFNFTKKYPLKTREWDYDWDHEGDTYQLNWEAIKKEFQGIIIFPYQYSCRLALESTWYYGWDCASGCIWDLKCIHEFKKTEEK